MSGMQRRTDEEGEGGEGGGQGGGQGGGVGGGRREEGGGRELGMAEKILTLLHLDSSCCCKSGL